MMVVVAAQPAEVRGDRVGSGGGGGSSANGSDTGEDTSVPLRLRRRAARALSNPSEEDT